MFDAPRQSRRKLMFDNLHGPITKGGERLGKSSPNDCFKKDGRRKK